MATETTTPDTAAPATAADAQVIDTAAAPAPAPAPEPALAEDDAILAAIRGEEPPKADADASTSDPAKPAADSQAAPAKAEPTAEDKAKEADAILDAETPKDYKGRTREQFERLRDVGRQHREEALKYKAELERLAPNIEREAKFTALLADSGGTPEDVGTSILLIRAVNKGSPQEKQGALQIVNAIRQILADQLGVPVDGVDYLADQADLKQRVADGDLSAEDAREIAVLRRKAKVDGETNAQRAAREQKEAEQQRAHATEAEQRQTAANTVKAAAEQYLKRDGKDAYAARVTYAQQAFARMNTITPVPPDKIAGVFRELYESPEAALLADAALAKTRQPVAGVRPVMGSRMGGTGAAVPEAQSEEDAVRMALRGA